MCLRCLAKEPDRRYPTAADVAADLLAGVGHPGEGRRWWPVLAGLVAGVALAGAVVAWKLAPAEAERGEQGYGTLFAGDLAALSEAERDSVLVGQRDAAGWAVENGGTLRVRLGDGAERSVGWKAEIPEAPFLVVRLALADAPVTDGDLTRLRRLPALESLRLERTRVTGSGLVHLAALRRLRELNLRSTPLTDSGVAGVSLPPTLERLGVSDIRVVDDYGFVRSATGLRFLDLSGASISNRGAAFLAVLTDLRSLDLSGTDITDDALSPLVGMKQLSRFRLTSRVTRCSFASQLLSEPRWNGLRDCRSAQAARPRSPGLRSAW